MTALVPDVPEFIRAAGALLAGDWMIRQDTGHYAVLSYGEAGVERVEYTGIHYPFTALAKVDDLTAQHAGERVVFIAVNLDDPEENVERAEEAFWVDMPRLCESNSHRVCWNGCGEVCEEAA